jgi:dTDP-glucose pyrophosphorylase/CBS domain-containing protein
MTQKRMRSAWQSFSVHLNASLRDAMLAIDQGRMGLALVTDGQSRLQGTVTDGDLRRAMLNGVGLEDPVHQVMNRGYVAVKHTTSEGDVLDLMHTRSIKQVPAVDPENHVVGVYFLPDLIALERPNWVVIMAGGEGRRLRPLTNDTPKPMLPVADRPLLEDTISTLVHHGFRDLFISIRYLGEQIEAHFGDGTQFGCHISYLKEDAPLGTAGALGLLSKPPDHPILVLNGDLMTDLNFSTLMEYHYNAGCAATQCVREFVSKIPFGVVHCENGQVVSIEEKPVQNLNINAGIYVLSPALLSFVVEDQPITMPELLTRALAQGHDVAAFPIRERWKDIGHLEDYHWVRENWFDSGEK